MECVAVNKNNQAIFVGGLDPDQIEQNPWNGTIDEWDNNIGVFDMHELRMKGQYDADAPAYSSPEIVSTRYKQG